MPLDIDAGTLETCFLYESHIMFAGDKLKNISNEVNVMDKGVEVTII
jgi:hypothetical protein